MMMIDEEFASLIPPLTAEEYAGLEESIINEGCRDALLVWNDTLIDGHNRYKICTKHNISFRTVQKDFTSRNEALLWIMKNQLSRRNLNDFQRIEIVHNYEDAVKAQAKSRQGTRNDLETCGQNFPEVKNSPKRATDELGAMAGVSRKTYEHATEILESAPAEIINAVREDRLSINAGYEVTKMPPEAKQEIFSRVRQGESPKEVINEVQKKPHVLYNTGNNEWYTPSEYIELARQVMGEIDLDPASSHIANRTVRARRYFTAEIDGLKQNWSGNVWLNPPYSVDLITKFADKLVNELFRINQAIVLVNNATETEWFNRLVRRSMAVCFPLGRVKFCRPDGTTGAPLQGQAVIYFGSQAKKFMEVFNVKGWCSLLQ